MAVAGLELARMRRDRFYRKLQEMMRQHIRVEDQLKETVLEAVPLDLAYLVNPRIVEELFCNGECSYHLDLQHCLPDATIQDVKEGVGRLQKIWGRGVTVIVTHEGETFVEIKMKFV